MSLGMGMTDPTRPAAMDIGQNTDATPTSDGFRYESEIVAALVRNATALGGEGQFVYLRTEWPAGPRVVDVAVGVFAEQPCSGEIAPALRRMSMFEVRLLAEVLRRPLRVATLSRRLHTPQEQVDRSVGLLVRRNILARTRGGAVAVTGWARYLPVCVKTIEAKLRDWRTALAQAAYCREFADHAYVVMPAAFGDHRQLLDACRSASVGLAVVAHDGRLSRPMHPPQRRGTPSLRRDVTAIRLLCQYLEETDHATSLQPATDG